ncbi:MAG: hypothetical protein OQJ97_18580 [Rhodospirillales bacterium]|nr:hypothetical protein [Rhodospirillales bacterium]
MKNISFFLTKQQVLNRTKTVTRRFAWWNIPPLTQLQGNVKCQGLKKGEKIVRLRRIEVISARIEPVRRLLDDPVYGKTEVILEGFPDLTPEQFVALLLKKTKETIESPVNRIEYRYLD